MPFKEGQEVLIKNPRPVVGVIVRERPGDRNESPENRRLLVRIKEDERFYLPADLEDLPLPSQELRRYSQEWNTQLQRWIDAGQKLMKNNHDPEALQDFSDAGSKIGFVRPIREPSS